jgi:hypothetical protein
VAVAVTVDEADTVGDRVGVTVGVTVRVAVGVAEAVALAVRVGVHVGVDPPAVGVIVAIGPIPELGQLTIWSYLTGGPR